ncbi:uncharacterized protein LOC106131082 [Amyelois transitella]|uniref:uncharacterized protein LOC106131082 n=1 Tax=Amyelois transitella TaxID=680683 RepID=UPI002990784F|nr:uncharacterized protein LOC106131082 [Amyelois transitella]
MALNTAIDNYPFTVVFLSNVVFADNENEIKGTYPYMAFIYYSDESVVDSTGSRFFRGAVLILKDWLLTSAVQTSDDASDVAFPRKTLLARLGAVGTDSKFTLNEDEDEQEREIIQIVRPYNHSATQWWRTDITLMQTLLPFNLTATVNLAPRIMSVPNDKPCFILAYARRYGNASEERLLVQSTVDLLPPSIANCGSHFFEETMTCGNDVEDNKNEFRDRANFCQGFKGGPLICDNSLVGLQTYVDSCKAPHLYQMISPWMHLISCATNNKCNQIECADLCVITQKDAPLTLESTTHTLSTEETTFAQEITNVTMTETTTESTSESSMLTSEFILQTQTTMKEVTEESHETTTAEVTTGSTVIEESEPQPIVLASAKPATSPSTQPSFESKELVSNTQQPVWPKAKEDHQKLQKEDCEEMKTINVQAQQEARAMPKKGKRKRRNGAAERNICVFQSVFCIFVLASFF